MAWGGFGKSGTKMGNVRTSCGKHSHRSKLEVSVCCLLQNREHIGEISDLECEVHIPLSEAKILYICDFKFKVVATGEIQYCEAKGFENDRWPMIKKLWKFYGPGALHVYKGTAAKPFLHEVIIPGVSK